MRSGSAYLHLAKHIHLPCQSLAHQLTQADNGVQQCSRPVVLPGRTQELGYISNPVTPRDWCAIQDERQTC